MAFELKQYQCDALQALREFLAAARGQTSAAQMQAAFDAARRASLGESAPPRAYRPFTAQTPEIPVACLRIPTGGGKTLMAAHAIDIVAREYVGARAPVALWLTPSNAIRTQTLDALRTPGHPYRQALLDHWPDDQLTVIDIADCHQLRAHDFGTRAIVVVGTVQTLRVDNTASREVYAYHEAFAPHFASAPDAEFFERVSERDLERHPYLTRGDLGRIKASFANLLAWHRPIVVMDEAHNAQTSLSLALLERIRPACVIEWTATPLPEQNVLYHVSAQELKAADMIKLPIVLAPHPNWREAVRDAVLNRDALAEDALRETDYVRPIVLFQAEPAGGEATVEVLKAHLMEQLHIDERRIAVATGRQRDLDGIDLFRRDCLIDFVITVEALKEGWDCSFAYVFCTAQNIRSAKDMEQLLGRVLRMPYATKRTSDRLNRAYAHVCGTRTAQVANQLADRLISMGFERMAAVQAVQPALNDLFEAAPDAEVVESEFEVPAAVARALAETLPQQVRIEPGEAEDGMRVTLRGGVEPAASEAAISAVPKAAREQLKEQLKNHEARVQAAAAPSSRGEVFADVPQLVIAMQGSLHLYEPELLGAFVDYSLTGLPADLPGFSREEERKPYLIDIEQGRLGVREDTTQYGLPLDVESDAIRREDVIRALDRRLRQDAILQPDMIAWLGRLLDGLERDGIDLVYLVRHLNAVASVAAMRLKDLLAGQRQRAFQQSLLPGEHRVRLDEGTNFRFAPDRYPARWLYEGRYRFSKHYYPQPGELKPELEAEETACAIEIDSLPNVRRWIRNLERQPDCSFWLPTSTDRFYPDFVAELEDGRLFVVEYKGGDRFSNDDSREKRDIGQAWAGASSGRCIFVMATDAATARKPVGSQLRDAITR